MSHCVVLEKRLSLKKKPHARFFLKYHTHKFKRQLYSKGRLCINCCKCYLTPRYLSNMVYSRAFFIGLCCLCSTCLMDNPCPCIQLELTHKLRDINLLGRGEYMWNWNNLLLIWLPFLI